MASPGSPSARKGVRDHAAFARQTPDFSIDSHAAQPLVRVSESRFMPYRQWT
jgi:hypothetical protein